jgi:hypothetical protein
VQEIAVKASSDDEADEPSARSPALADTASPGGRKRSATMGALLGGGVVCCAV